MTKAITGLLTDLDKQRAAMKAREGLPKKNPGFPANGGKHAPIPDVYTPDAGGWTEEVCEPPVDAKDGTGVLLVRDDLATKLDGQKGTVSGQQVTIDLKTAVDVSVLPKKYADIVEPKHGVVVVDEEIKAK